MFSAERSSFEVSEWLVVFGSVQLFQLFINYHKFYKKQYPLPAVSRLASRGEQWLHVCNIYTDRSQERLEKNSS